MAFLLQHLEHMPFRELRAVATRLNVRSQANRDANEEWRRVIDAFWQSPERASQLISQLSPQAQAALAALKAADCIPAPLFLREYGAIRRPGATARSQSSPWNAPESPAEELYYAGLLHAHTPVSIHRAKAVTLPDDLRSLVAVPSLPNPHDEDADWDVLLHDCAQTLIFLHQHGRLHFSHGRWLPLGALQALNQRLLRPAPQPLISHKRAAWPAFLFFLCDAAGFIHQGSLTPTCWVWLAEPPVRQLAQLWQAWQTASPSLRTLYGRPDGHLPPPWPLLLTRLLGQQVASFTARSLSSRLFASPVEFQPFIVAHFQQTQELTDVIAHLLAADLSNLGIVRTTAPTNDRSRSPDPDQPFFLTRLGVSLLHSQGDVSLPSADRNAAPATCVVEQPDGWRFEAPINTPPHPLALLAPYLRSLELHQEKTRHCLLLDRHSIAQASASGHGLPALLGALQDLGITLTARQVGQLHAWHEAGQTLQLLHLPILRASTTEQMQLVRAAPRLNYLFGELLSPTVSVLHAPPAEVARQLAQAGFYAAPHELFVESSELSPTAGVEGVLWLAAKLYTLVSQHAELPLPPPAAAIQSLWGALSQAQQVTLQGLWQQVHEEFQRLLEGLAATPSPTPSDPEQWRPLIDRALAEHRHLELHYFSAARNLLTRRIVAPYWIEQRRWGPCLVGWCHAAGRVLTFRLDRIQALEIGDNTLMPVHTDPSISQR